MGWFGGDLRRAYKQPYFITALKRYLNKPWFSSVLSSYTKLQDLNLSINSQLNPFVDSQEYERLDCRNVRDPNYKNYKVLNLLSHLL